MRRPGRSTPRLASAVAAVVVALCLTVGCGSVTSTSEQAEVADDPSRVTAPGPLPTAPPATEPGEGLTGEAARLVTDLDALRAETDLCAVLTDDTLGRLVASDVEAAGLVTSPAGIAQLVALVDSTFSHLVAISPEEVRPAMDTIRDLWAQLATIGTAPDAEARANELLARPEVTIAVDQLAGWAAVNCPGVAPALPGL